MDVSAPLQGMRILDLSWLLPGPFCTSILADLGAEVIKVEAPGAGDYMRDLLPDVFQAVNRNKRSVCLNLKEPGGKALLFDLARDADVLIEGFRPGVVDRLGIGYNDLAAHNRRLVYVSLSGYGASGPYANRPGHDLNYLAASGALAIPGRWGRAPERGGLPIGDLSAAMYAAISILAALRRRDRTGQGAFLDVSIADSLLALTQVRIAGHLNHGASGWSHLSPANDTFMTADGKALTLCLVEEHFWAAFCRVAGRGDMLENETLRRARSSEATDEDGQALRDALEALVAARPLAEWLELLAGTDIPYAKVNQPGDLEGDPQIGSRGGIRRMSQDDATLMLDFPVPQLRRETHERAPAHGAHTDQVLMENGVSKQECEALRERGIIK